ncbi:MAG: endonuclease/exonuclease/phosphatase family protein [Acidobacteriota bacterium]
MGALRTGVAIAVAGALALRCAGARHPHEPLRLATFNIEDFPQHDAQVAGAFDELAHVGAAIVAVQEIVDPARFERELHARFGASWSFVHTDDGSHELGVMFDRAAWTLVSVQIHDETRLGGNHKPVLDVRLRGDDGELVRVLVVHLKSGTPGRDVRARQHAALVPIVRAAVASGEHVVVMGDFNATEDADRADLASLARATHLAWATEPLACSAFWRREDGCWRSRLDHVLTFASPESVAVAGACASEGCERQDRCPRYVREVSDHCPVVVELPRR